MLNYQRVGALKVSDGRNPSNHCGFLRSNIAGRPVGLILIMYSWFFISPKYTYGKVMEKHTYNIYIYLFMYVYIYTYYAHHISCTFVYCTIYIYIPISTYLLCMYMFDLYYISTYLYSVYIYTYIYIWL